MSEEWRYHNVRFNFETTAYVHINLTAPGASISFILEDTRSEHGKVKLQDHDPQTRSPTGVGTGILGGEQPVEAVR